MAKKSRVSMRKYEGDHLCSWAVFVDGYAKWTGMSRSEAAWRRDRERRASSITDRRGHRSAIAARIATVRAMDALERAAYLGQRLRPADRDQFAIHAHAGLVGGHRIFARIDKFQ